MSKANQKRKESLLKEQTATDQKETNFNNRVELENSNQEIRQIKKWIKDSQDQMARDEAEVTRLTALVETETDK